MSSIIRGEAGHWAGVPQFCEVGNISALQLGWTHVAPNITNNPVFTWALTENNLAQGVYGNSLNSTMQRNFLLGIPPTVSDYNLDHLDPWNGCALFFESAAANNSILNPSLKDNEGTSGTPQFNADCNATLGDSCVGDLVSQTQSLLQKGFKGPTSTWCSALKDALIASPPQSCSNIANDGNWQPVVAAGKWILTNILEHRHCEKNSADAISFQISADLLNYPFLATSQRNAILLKTIHTISPSWRVILKASLRHKAILLRSTRRMEKLNR
jgi:hypothetical protein